MKQISDSHLKLDILKLCFLIIAVFGTITLFVITPALSTPTLISIIFTMLMSPLVTKLERRGYPRILSITIIFIIIGTGFGLLTFVGIQTAVSEWHSFREAAPTYFQAFINRLKTIEADWKAAYPFLRTVSPSNTIIGWTEDTGRWFVTHGPALVGEFLTWLIIVPFLTFVLLYDGRSIKKKFFELVPNRFFESAFMMTTAITDVLANYLRAKLLEAFLVGIMTTIGLAIVKAPYAIVLGVTAAVTNIIPYVGPVLGVTPGLLIAAFDTSHPNLLWSMLVVYGIVNIIDMVFIFPVVVAKLVNLHPLYFIAVLAVGQTYYGLIGMLISIPLATIVKVILEEIHSAIYERYHHKIPGQPASTSD